MQAAAAAKPLSIAGCPVGVQAMALKAQLRADFKSTLDHVADMGYGEIELCSFKGFAGDHLRGDFGELANLDPIEIRRAVSNSGLILRSCQFKPAELDDEKRGETLDWALATGIERMVLVDVYFGNLEWNRTLDQLNCYGEQVRAAGLQFALHSPNDFWTRHDGKTGFEAMLSEVPRETCSLQLDLSATLVSGIDPVACIESALGRVWSLHLRDGIKPPRPVPYLPALPLGQGEIDLPRVISSAKENGVSSYIVEMIVMPPLEPIDAYKQSADSIYRLES